MILNEKVCRHCGKEKPLGFFPGDRTRPDGRWHTCRLCNYYRWKEQGKAKAAQRKAQEAARRQERQGLAGLQRFYHNRKTCLSPALQQAAELIFQRSIARAKYEGRPLTRQRIAALIANAVSNAPRLGNRSWSRSILRRKGWVRAMREQAAARSQAAQSHPLDEPKARTKWLLD